MHDTDGAPVQDVLVAFSAGGVAGSFVEGSGGPTRPQDDVTDSSGQASVKFRPTTATGDIQFSASASGYETGSEQVTVTGPSNITFNVESFQRDSQFEYEITVRVRNRLSGEYLRQQNYTIDLSPSSAGDISHEGEGDWGNRIAGVTNDGGYIENVRIHLTGEADVSLVFTISGVSWTWSSHLGGMPTVIEAFVRWDGAGDFATFTPNGERLFMATANSAAKLIDTSSWQQVASNADGMNGGAEVDFDSIGDRFATAVYVYDASADGLSSIWRSIDSNCGRSSIDWSRSGTKFVGNDSNEICLHDQARSNGEMHVVTVNQDRPRDVKFNPDMSQVLVGMDDGVWQLRSAANLSVQTELSEISVNSNDIRAVDWSPDGAQYVLGFSKTGPRVYDSSSHSPLPHSYSEVTNLVDVAWSQTLDSSRSGYGMIAAQDADGSVFIYRPDQSGALMQLQGGAGNSDQTSVSWSPDGELVAIAGGGWAGVFAPWDNVPPIVSINSHPSVATVYQDSVTLEGTVSDAIGVTSISISVGGGAAQDVAFNGFGEFAHNLSLALGNNSVVITARDYNGNDSSITLALSRSIDDSAPIIIPRVHFGAPGEQILISARITDRFAEANNLDEASLSAIVKDSVGDGLATLVLVDDGSNGDLIAQDDIFSAFWQSPDGDEGYYFVDFAASDQAGNNALLSNVVLGVFDDPRIGQPVTTPLSPTDQESVTLTFPANDSSGISHVAFLYSADTGETYLPVSVVAADDQWEVTLPVLRSGAVRYRISALDQHGQHASLNGTYSVAHTGPQSEPGSPVRVTAIPGDGLVAASWEVPDHLGGDSILSYDVTTIPPDGTATTGATSTVITGLRNGFEYRLRVSARNTVGSGATSTPSDNVVPVAPPVFVRAFGTDLAGAGRFDRPGGIAIDSGGNVYVADSSNSRIQKFTADGTFITSWGGNGDADGKFYYPIDVAIGPQGNVYVADYSASRIQKFTPDGEFISKWGTRGNGEGDFQSPRGIAIDASGNVFVAEQNDRVQKFTTEGAFILSWEGVGGEGSQNGQPRGISTDLDGNVYVTDGADSRIHKFSSEGLPITAWGSRGYGGNAEFTLPDHIATDAENNVYVSDYGQSRVQVFTSNGEFLYIFGEHGDSTGQFDGTSGVAIGPSGDIYVSSPRAHTVQRFNSIGGFINRWGSDLTSEGHFKSPMGIAIDEGGNFYVADAENSRIQKFGPTGSYLMSWGERGSDSGQLFRPQGIAISPVGDVWVVDSGNERIQIYDEFGILISSISLNLSDNIGDFPTDIGFDNEGNAYVAVAAGNWIQKLGPDGTNLGGWGTPGSGDGEFSWPKGVAVDGDGFVYVAEEGNRRIQKFTSDGIFVGKWSVQDGWFSLKNITVDDENLVYVVVDGRVRQFTTNGFLLSAWGSEEIRNVGAIAVSSRGNYLVVDTGRHRVVLYERPLVPAASSNVEAHAGDQSAEISWAEVTSDVNGAALINPVTSYRLNMVPAAPDGEIILAPPFDVNGGTISVEVPGLTNGVSYVAWVVAVNEDGPGYTGVSNTLSPAAEAIGVNIVGTIYLQGVSSETAFEAIGPQIVLTDNVGGASTTFTVSSDGSFVISGVNEGTYTIRITALGFVANGRDDLSVSNTPLVMPDMELRGGEVNGDGAVSILDISAIAAAFGDLLPGRVDGQGRPIDINADGLIDILDISIAASNFGLREPQGWN
ncbi:MAG: fibronectin type III domain-containing protein [Chloroflexi bacterium]|nr:fibronectin type III domain-containing protein [Chloroflexota bacterium]